MSIMGTDKIKRILPRSGPDAFWQAVIDHYAGHDDRKWTSLAMLALREDADWPLKFIALVFGCSKGNVARRLQRIKRELRERFDLPIAPPSQAIDHDEFAPGAD
jgi:hypothetical protein